MNLANDRFYRGNFNFRRVTDGPVEAVPMHSYETGTALYDVLTIDGNRLFRVDCRWSDRKPIHAAIEKHFAL